MTKLSPAEFKELEKATPSKNKMLKNERAYLLNILANRNMAYIYYGGKHLNAIGHPPKLNKIRFIVKHK